MEAPATQQSLTDAARAVFAEVANPKAPGLQAMAERAALYAHIDPAEREIVLDMRAILLGSLDSGLSAYVGQGAASNWLVEWVRPHVTDLDRRVRSGRTGDKDLLDAFAQGYRVVASRSVRGKLIPRALALAQVTVKRNVVDLRHVLIACLESAIADPPSWRGLGWQPTEADHRDFRLLFVSKLQAGRERGESLTAWRAELGLSDRPPPQPQPRPEPAANLSGFTADRPDGDSRSDPLAVQQDVEAFARLIAFSGTDTPLSIGVFGSWGSGKSTFMERLEDEIARIAEGAGPPRAGPRMLGRIVQVRFNAWHFADANLWASLTAEFFDQLRSGGYDKQGEAIHARLVERVNAHVHDLTAAAGQTRQAVSAGEQKLAQAQKARDEAVGQASADMSQKLLDALGKTYQANRAQIAAISGQAGASDDLDLLIHAAQNAPRFWGKLRVIGKAAARKPARLAAVLGVMIVGVGLLFAPDLLGWTSARDLIAAYGAGGAAALAGFVALLAPGVQLLNMVISGTAGVEKELQAAKTEQLKTVLAAEAALKAAADEAAARRQASDRASQALSRYIDPTSQGNPPRLLRYMLDDDPDTRALEKEIGLMGRARRLFEAVDQIVEAERAKGEKADPQTPERIVLYIDDLDRCTHEQVYAVLQAVHLLLAFKLFVVVVAVDVNWVTEALANQAGRRMDAGAAPETDATQKNSRARAVAYLEKIFQLPFWIRPMGGDGAVYGEFVRGLLKGRVEAAEPPSRGINQTPENAEAPPAPAATGPGPAESDAESGKDPSPAPSRTDETPAPPRDDLRTLAFSEAEAGFLASPELAAIASTTPRGVLRMINIYRIVRLTAPAPEADAKPLWPLIAVFAAVETGGEADLADALYTELKALETGYAVDPNPAVKATARAINTIIEGRKGLAAALSAAAAQRGEKTLRAGDCLAAARAVRRYSFNRY